MEVDYSAGRNNDPEYIDSEDEDLDYDQENK